MTEMEKVIKGLEVCTRPGTRGCFYDIKECPYDENGCRMALMRDALSLIKEQDAEISRISNAYLELVGKASKQPNVVRCKDCKHRGDRHKCIVAFVAEKQEMPYFFYDNNGKWFCADGVKKDE
jgi:hypothetical protein